MKIGGQPRVIPRRNRRRFVSLESDVADPRRRQQLEYRVKHSEPCSEYRYHDDVTADDVPFGLGERSLNRGWKGGHIAKDLGSQQHTDPVGGAPEGGWIDASVPELHQRVLDQRVIDNAHRHW
jgi:hypothetical protein